MKYPNIKVMINATIDTGASSTVFNRHQRNTGAKKSYKELFQFAVPIAAEMSKLKKTFVKTIPDQSITNRTLLIIPCMELSHDNSIIPITKQSIGAAEKANVIVFLSQAAGLSLGKLLILL